MSLPWIAHLRPCLQVDGGAALTDAGEAPQRDEAKKLECRFYQEEYPEVEELVMVKVVNIADMAAEVVLLEYNDIEVRNRTDGES